MKKQFKILLEDLDLDPSQRIYSPLDKVIVNIPTEFDNQLKLNVVYTIYKNKTSFLYQEFEKNQDSERILSISNKLNMNTPGRVSRVDWQINFSTDPRHFTLKDNRKILFCLLRNIESIIKTGDGINGPKPNDILVGLPWHGSFITPIQHPENARKRSLLNKKFGFGDVDDYNYQYAIYDKDLNLNPI
jgi:hypothetical protein